MAIGYFMAHFPKSFFPLLNGGDAAVLYCFVFLYLAVRRRRRVEPGPVGRAAQLIPLITTPGSGRW